MAKFLKHLGIGSKKAPPQPPTRDYLSDYTTPQACTTCVASDRPSTDSVSGASPVRESVCSKQKHSPQKEPRNVKNTVNIDCQIPPIVDEYSDPIDLKTTDGLSSQISNEDDYTEPYEALKLLQKKQEENGKRSRDNAYEDTLPIASANAPIQKLPAPNTSIPPTIGQSNVDQRPKQDYDEPWTDNKAALRNKLVISNDDDHAYTHLKRDRVREIGNTSSHDESLDRSPNKKELEGKIKKANDRRPVDDYDKPWDQSRLSQISSEKSRDSRPDEDYDEPWDNNALMARLNLGFECNTSLPLEQQKWYHGAISRLEAEKRLKYHREGSFLIRRSESDRSDHSLSLKSSHGFMHMKIVIRDNCYILGQFSQPFQNIPQMVQHYSLNKLPIKGAEHTSLLYPVKGQ
ncbi:DgyrCDS4032 [Dimorphilus gyrociliatus]|uniref:DgyrCDS4032 n=1 Tax=Dimorphilus gyrociliatus TaxID=2664684 RepID=A0A7I8VFP4_9ANNE|nr:DgyrCDS4032 [Dimorphilus gyrociliatus]